MQRRRLVTLKGQHLAYLRAMANIIYASLVACFAYFVWR